MSDPTIYTVAWICAIGTELVAAKQFLDQTHDDADQLPNHDDNTYVLGNIARHNIVIAALPQGQYGLVSAAIVARDMVRSFPNLRFALMVGIGGGAPSKRHDIRLGDIVVSSPGSGMGGVLQYDFGKTIQDESLQTTGHLNQSPQCLLRAIPFLEADYESDGNGIDEKIVHVLEKKPLLRKKYGKPDSSTDRLFNSTYKHAGDNDQECTATCVDTELIVRSTRSEEQDGPNIHFGLIASANQLMKDAHIRDQLSSEKDVLCFEMEAAGLMNQFSCLVVRGICDYSDTHKNKAWQGYAAMAAAAYAKDLLRKVAPNRIEAERRLADVLSGVDSKLEDINSQMKATHTEIESIQKDKHSNDIFQWIDPPDVSSNLNKAIKARHPGSGLSLLESKAYTTWKRQKNSFLWLHGIPGCGKTVLASTIIEDLQREQCQNPSQALLYFYFDFTDSRKQSFENALRSFVCQMHHQSEKGQKHLNSLYSQVCRNGSVQPSSDALQKTLAGMIGDTKEVWIVLDALDECTFRYETLSWLRSFTQGSSMQAIVHLLVTSRPEHDIKADIQGYASDEEMISIQDDLLEVDIRNYVKARVREHEGLSRWRGHKGIQDKIEASLIERADGMFRWVALQLDALEGCFERKALLKTLQNLPETLDETYERILANIPSAHMHYTRRILQFLTYSDRPLRLEEAVDAIAVDVEEGVIRGHRFDPEDRLPVPEEITRYCSGLVVLVSRPAIYVGAPIVKEIQLAHFSVQEYLTSTRIPSEISGYLQKTLASSSIAKVCLAYLSELQQGKAEYEISEDFPLARYSAQYWAKHAVLGERDNECISKLATELLLDHPQTRDWCLFYNRTSSWRKPQEGTPLVPALYYASLLGFPRCFKILLGEGANPNAQGGYYGNALQAASKKGHKAVVKILLDQGKVVQGQGGSHTDEGTSDIWSEEMVQKLLNKEAAEDKQAGVYGIALMAAFCEGHQEAKTILAKLVASQLFKKTRSKKIAMWYCVSISQS
ncbi:hypothetical protein PFICI_02937 [Pestalotiopsis fici W106-1]|uniref:NACHT domain-containing protein n=1 Tax=Pestalotiopsis fici (strain W106-1 / CGMCC3.15140) TaxID=1229662 RepID=W3XHK3_PESFW|nr:uncharacterized protein PFICI_02937 [Pestalotiopsis fici W106-1]ETS84912.1 hypothetical protein PFICI_02937 [Pestalotiopsis fici W106-1]